MRVMVSHMILLTLTSRTHKVHITHVMNTWKITSIAACLSNVESLSGQIPQYSIWA